MLYVRMYIICDDLYKFSKANTIFSNVRSARAYALLVPRPAYYTCLQDEVNYFHKKDEVNYTRSTSNIYWMTNVLSLSTWIFFFRTSRCMNYLTQLLTSLTHGNQCNIFLYQVLLAPRSSSQTK